MKRKFYLLKKNFNLVPKISGIYEIRVKGIKKKRYVGSTINFYGRFQSHVLTLLRGKHFNPEIQKLFNRHGSNLYFRILIICPTTQLCRIEQSYLDIEMRNRYTLNRLFNATNNLGKTLEDIK